MNGTPTPCIKYYAQKKGITVLDVYKKVFNNKTIKFDLMNDSTKFVCRNNKYYNIKCIRFYSETQIHQR